MPLFGLNRRFLAPYWEVVYILTAKQTKALQALLTAPTQAQAAQLAGLAILSTLDVREHIAPVYYSLHADIEAGAHSTFNLPGGRGSGKSSFILLPSLQRL